MRKLTAAILAAATCIGGTTLPMSLAQAQDLELRLGPDGIRPVVRDRDRMGYDDRGCSPGEARAAARDEGLRRPEVVRVTSRSVTVEGEVRGRVDTIRFANEPGCPEL